MLRERAPNVVALVRSTARGGAARRLVRRRWAERLATDLGSGCVDWDTPLESLCTNPRTAALLHRGGAVAVRPESLVAACEWKPRREGSSRMALVVSDLLVVVDVAARPRVLVAAKQGLLRPQTLWARHQHPRVWRHGGQSRLLFAASLSKGRRQ